MAMGEAKRQGKEESGAEGNSDNVNGDEQTNGESVEAAHPQGQESNEAREQRIEKGLGGCGQKPTGYRDGTGNRTNVCECVDYWLAGRKMAARCTSFPIGVDKSHAFGKAFMNGLFVLPSKKAMWMLPQGLNCSLMSFTRISCGWVCGPTFWYIFWGKAFQHSAD